ncbi:MAG: DNA starvation/stationary phase protection protein Dps [Dehalococcoidia bacterium]|nr:DNA starvation/stationary phase protection protein Dps [Dehalococcoidia bacterium]MCA9830145.1 DNA starvation/stationary phase protection protein Dps [Dehalococcoidia bacterium]MCB9487071.1 DNA starvation/stationary phase protection protein Dps [Thermoflexaceae bacterium]
MVTKTEILTAPVGALAAGRRAEIIAELNTNLAYLTDLHVSAKQAHWNVHGPNFVGLHGLFDTITFAARDYADLVAERVLALRGTAHGTIADVASMEEIRPFPTDEHGWEELTRAVRDRLITAAERMRLSATSTDDEQVTQDIYIEVIRGLEKWAWMLEAHLS